jgi:hypothetical protein
MTGRTYLERGRPVTVLVGWRNGQGEPELDQALRTVQRPRYGPKNVMVRREDGSIVIRPFRGLRKAGDAPGPAA